MTEAENSRLPISVVIPAYNSGEHIARAIESVLNQSRPADEIIVVNDGSTDNTADIVKGYGDKVRYIFQENAGVSVARNTGIDASTGSWIAFLDADDEWLVDKLKLQSEHLQRNSDLKWTFSNFHMKRPDSDEIQEAHRSSASKSLLNGQEYFDDYLNAFANHFYAWTSTIMVKKDVFSSTGMFEPGMKRAQDSDLWFRIAYKFPPIGYLAEPLAIYHMDTPGSSTKVNDNADYMVSLIKRQQKLSAESGRDKAFETCIINMVKPRIIQFLDQKRYNDVKILIDNFQQFLPPRYKRELKFRLTCPPVTMPTADLIHKLKKAFKSSKSGGSNGT